MIEQKKNSTNVLIIGGSGFIGKNVIEKLSQKYNILAPSHKELDLIDDQKVRNFFLTNNVDTIVHTAVKPGHRNAKDVSNIFYNNSRMFFNIIRNAEYYKKLIFIGSGACYDMRYYKPKMSETYFDSRVPVDDHGFQKYIAAKFVELADKNVELRVFGVFGKYEDYSIRFISNAICKTLFDLPITIKQNRKLDYVYIDDLVQVIDYFINNSSEQVAYNVTPDKPIELYTVAEKVRAVSGKKLPIKIAKSGLGMEYSGDNARLKKEIPGLTFMPIDGAIRQLYDWYSRRKHLVNKELLLVDK